MMSLVANRISSTQLLIIQRSIKYHIEVNILHRIRNETKKTYIHLHSYSIRFLLEKFSKENSGFFPLLVFDVVSDRLTWFVRSLPHVSLYGKDRTVPCLFTSVHDGPYALSYITFDMCAILITLC